VSRAKGPSVVRLRGKVDLLAQMTLQFQQQFPGTDSADAMVILDGTIPGVTYMPDAKDGTDSIAI
jgi:hypothetical protein